MFRNFQVDEIQEAISLMNLNCLSAGFLPKRPKLSTNATYKAGPSEISAKDLESFLPEPSSTFGPGHNSTMKSFQSTAGSITTKPSKTNSNGDKSTVTSTMDLIFISFRQIRPLSKSLSGTIIELTPKERKNNTLRPFKPCPKCKSLTGTKNLKSALMENKIKCTS